MRSDACHLALDEGAVEFGKPREQIKDSDMEKIRARRRKNKKGSLDWNLGKSGTIWKRKSTSWLLMPSKD